MIVTVRLLLSIGRYLNNNQLKELPKGVFDTDSVSLKKTLIQLGEVNFSTISIIKIALSRLSCRIPD